MKRNSDDETKPKTRRVTLARLLAPLLAAIPGATGAWRLITRKGRYEIQVDVKDGESQCELLTENKTSLK